jgi:hypothetical protein
MPARSHLLLPDCQELYPTGRRDGRLLRCHCRSELRSPGQGGNGSNRRAADLLGLPLCSGRLGRSSILDLSTQPAWLYEQGGDVHHIPDSPYAVDWGYPTGEQLVDASCDAIGQYFGRVVAWYSVGGFTDEYGLFHPSPFRIRIPLFEVLNEMEHNTDIQTYSTQQHSAAAAASRPPSALPHLCSAVRPAASVCIYDAAVKWIREYADPEHRIQFVGLAEEDPTRSAAAAAAAAAASS